MQAVTHEDEKFDETWRERLKAPAVQTAPPIAAPLSTSTQQVERLGDLTLERQTQRTTYSRRKVFEAIVTVPVAMSVAWQFSATQQELPNSIQSAKEVMQGFLTIAQGHKALSIKRQEQGGMFVDEKKELYYQKLTQHYLLATADLAQRMREIGEKNPRIIFGLMAPALGPLRTLGPSVVKVIEESYGNVLRSSRLNTTYSLGEGVTTAGGLFTNLLGTLEAVLGTPRAREARNEVLQTRHDLYDQLYLAEQSTFSFTHFSRSAGSRILTDDMNWQISGATEKRAAHLLLALAAEALDLTEIEGLGGKYQLFAVNALLDLSEIVLPGLAHSQDLNYAKEFAGLVEGTLEKKRTALLELRRVNYVDEVLVPFADGYREMPVELQSGLIIDKTAKLAHQIRAGTIPH